MTSLISDVYSESRLTGEWFSINNSNRIIGTSRVFYEGGRFEYKKGFMAKFRYEIDKDKLIFYMKPSNKTYEYTFDLADHKVVMINKERKEKLVYTRLSKNTNGLIGKWIGEITKFGREIRTFTEDNICYSQFIFTYQTGNYRLVGDQLIESINGKKYKWKISLSDNVLNMVSENGDQKYQYINIQKKLGESNRILTDYLLKSMKK